MAAELLIREQLGQFFNELGLTGTGVEIRDGESDFSKIVNRTWRGKEWTPVAPLPRGESNVGGGYGLLPRLREIQPERVATADQVDIVCLNCARDASTIIAELLRWWPRLKPGGIVFGPDYIDEWRWTANINNAAVVGVKTAVDWFARHMNRCVITTQEAVPLWWIRKPVGCPSSALVVSGSTRDVLWRDLAIHNHQRYCSLQGVPYQHPDFIGGVRHPSWEKLGLVRQALEEAEWVLWLDVDTIIQRADISLDCFWDGSAPYLFFTDQVNGLNTGVFFARACQEAKDFLEKWEAMSLTPKWRDHVWWENGALMEIQRQGELIGLVLPQRVADSYPHYPEFWSATDFIAHAAGLQPHMRLPLLQDLAFRADLAFDEFENE